MGNIHTLSGLELTIIGTEQAEALGTDFHFVDMAEGRKKVHDQALTLINKPCPSSSGRKSKKEACLRKGCTKLTGGGFCSEHQKENQALAAHYRYHRLTGTQIGQRFTDLLHLRAGFVRGEVEFVKKGNRKTLVMPSVPSS